MENNAVENNAVEKIAVVGAGLSGLTFAKHMLKRSAVTVFEKSRGIGGRMATRYAQEYEFDHGAQYFTAKSEPFQTFLKPYLEQGIVKDWKPNLINLSKTKREVRVSNHPSYVASPRMNALAKSIAEEVTIHGETHIESLEGQAGDWVLIDKEGQRHGGFHLVVFAIPSHQALTLLPDDFEHYNALKHTKMDGCFSVMLGFENPIEFGFDGAFVEDGSIGWMCVNTSKPERPSGLSLMVQSRNDWAEANINEDKQAVMKQLIEEASSLTGHDLSSAHHQTVHRWLYASTSVPAGNAYFYDKPKGLAAIGDWCIKGRVEAAFESGFLLAENL